MSYTELTAVPDLRGVLKLLEVHTGYGPHKGMDSGECFLK